MFPINQSGQNHRDGVNHDGKSLDIFANFTAGAVMRATVGLLAL